ncbi:hypothetical protein PEP31012_04666 [Pandoraea eparura]|uniref:Uncharacterized protein n=1 Tax=Pandoraea eparura TaxID=2508291 RepID=A0A5E4YN50_9BURK|nr:hypothetical protein PEP31012_04666 [Pandoraea eparura]
MAAHAIVVAVREHPQQTRLQIERHVADFIEEQRAALGLLEAPASRGLRAGERAALVAKKFGFQQILRNRRRVQGDEGPGGTRRMTVQCPRDQLLARPRFAGDEHRGARMRETADRAEHVLHGARLPKNLRLFGNALVVRRLAQAFLDRAQNQLDRAIDVERLGEIFERAALKGRDGAVQIRECRHDDDRQSRMSLLDRLQQLEPGTARHADVRDQHLRRVVFERRAGFARAGKAAHRQIGSRERLFEHPSNRLVVVYYPDRLHCSPCNVYARPQVLRPTA